MRLRSRADVWSSTQTLELAQLAQAEPGRKGQLWVK